MDFIGFDETTITDGFGEYPRRFQEEISSVDFQDPQSTSRAPLSSTPLSSTPISSTLQRNYSDSDISTDLSETSDVDYGIPTDLINSLVEPVSILPNHQDTLGATSQPEVSNLSFDDEEEDDIISITENFVITEDEKNPQYLLVLNGSRNKKMPVIVIAPYGFTLHINKPIAGGKKLAWRCSKASHCKGVGCPAKAHTKSIESIISNSNITGDDVYILEVDVNIELICDHTGCCPMVPGAANKILLIRECKRMAIDPQYRNFANPRDILKIAMDKHVPKNMSRNLFPKPENLCKMINRERKGTRAIPPMLNGSDILTWELNADQLSLPISGVFYRGDCTSVYKGKTRRHFIFFSDYQKRLLRGTKEMKVDGTFKIVEKPLFQLVSVHGTVRRPAITRNAPLAYILMQGKTTADYISVFQKLKSLVEDDGRTMQLTRMVMDFEKALWNAARAVWPNVKFRACWFHLCQNIYKKVKFLELSYQYLHDAGTEKMVRRLMTLALLDCEGILICWNMLKEHYEDEIQNSTKVEKLFDYFESQWITPSNVGFVPSDWSVFNKNIRTNNQLENWNGRIYRKGGSKRLDICKLTVLLAQDCISTKDELLHYSQKMYVKKVQVEKETAVIKAYQQYNLHKKPWSAMEDLRVATHKHCNWSQRDMLYHPDEPSFEDNMTTD